MTDSTQSMRVLMLHPHDVRYYPWTVRIVKLAEELAKRGHEVKVAYIEHKRAEEPDFHPLREIPEGTVEYVGLRSRDKQTHKNIRSVVDLARDVDIIHFQKCFASAFIPALWASWVHKKPLHYDWDDNETLILREILGLPVGFASQAHFFEKRVPDYVDTISVASDGLWEECVRLGFPEDRMVKVPVGADLTAFNPNMDGRWVREKQPLNLGSGPIVSYIGQLEGAAYASLFLEACRLLSDQHPDVKWLVVGGGAMLEELEETAFEHDLLGRVVFTDYLPSSQVPAILAATDITVACFSDEDFVRCKSPLKVAEYLAAGKAIVASNVGEVPWMTGGAAVLVQPGSAEALAKGIADLLANPSKRKDLEVQARRRAEEEINWARSAEKLESAYELAIR
ncbi:MAG: glycosyltransferase family 4 protein [Candidatus Omnitrophica bacterium]|nr:glycosyltransferase family 4 protein [Candidatus Omnitrophota bacterium]